MSESSVSEHGFDLRDSEHQAWTNRYVFRYPETWASQMMDSSLTVGLRSIILKPDPVEINLSGMQIVSVNNQPLATYLCVDGEIAYERPSLNGMNIYPDRFNLLTDMEANEGVKLGDICNQLNDLTNSEIIRYSDLYDRAKDSFDSSHANIRLEDFCIDYHCVNFSYNKNREFIMESANPEQIKFMAVYDIDDAKQSASPSDMSPKDPVSSPTKTSRNSLYVFSKDFENLLNIRLERTGIINNLNELLFCLAGLNKDIPPATAQNIAAQMGIEFDGVQTISYSIDPEYTLNDDGSYDSESLPVRYAHCILFTSLVVSNVWSRKDVLLRSSIAELDVRNYLGYSTMTTSSPVCIYAQPKMYPIESQSYKFWVDVYDSFNEEPIELPDNVILIIEAALHINPKIQFNRY